MSQFWRVTFKNSRRLRLLLFEEKNTVVPHRLTFLFNIQQPQQEQNDIDIHPVLDCMQTENNTDNSMFDFATNNQNNLTSRREVDPTINLGADQLCWQSI